MPADMHCSVQCCTLSENYLVRTTDDQTWRPITEVVDTSDLHAGQMRYWEQVIFPQER